MGEYEYEDIDEIPWSDDKEWRIFAKCSGLDTEQFFPPRNKELYKPIADVAKAICNGTEDSPPCPVKLQCLEYAIQYDEQHGIWGGLSHRERNVLVRKRARAARKKAKQIES